MSTLPPRIVVVSRPSEWTELVARHGTAQQARFALGANGPHPSSDAHPRDVLAELAARHDALASALHEVLSAIPEAWRRAQVLRHELPRFLFEPEDLIVVVGQDGLVANVAKYLDGQPVLGINPARALNEGVLVRHPPSVARDALQAFARHTLATQDRTMVQAQTADGQRILALNEVFVGHRTHQSARYRIALGAAEPTRQSSSGVIVTTGTGATGWAKSIARGRAGAPTLPAPEAPELAFFVREAWPSITTSVVLTDGLLAPGDALVITSEMNDGGTAFGDGIEDDRLDLPYGQTLTIGRAPQTLRLA